MSDTDSMSCEGSVSEREPSSPREMQDGFCQTDRLSSSSNTSTTSESPCSAGTPDSGDAAPPKITWEEKLNQARDYKAQGNDRYKANEYKQAIGKYHRALLFTKGIEDAQHSMPFMPETEEYNPNKKIPEYAQKEVYELKLACYNNLAACILQTDSPMYTKVIQYCDSVLELSPNNTKALYRKGVALYEMKNIEKALQSLQMARQQPQGSSDKNIMKYLAKCEEELNRQEKKLKKTYQHMFAKMAVDDAVDGDEEDVFSTSPDDPNMVKPQRKLQKARSTDTSPY